jgi:hypothetical protein
MSAANQINEILNKLTKDNQVAPTMDATSQTFIRDNIFIFSDNSRNTLNPDGWQSFICVEEKDTDTILTKIGTGAKNYKSLTNMSTLDKSILVPKIDLFKVIIDGNTRKKTKEIPIEFPDSSKENIEEIISSRGQRGDDVAIKSFTFDFKNQDPFGASRIVDCVLVLTMTSGESLVKKRKGGFTFADLIVRNNRLDPERFDSAYYEIKANVGYNVPSRGISPDLKEQLKNNNVSMMLFLQDYDISFQQNGVLQLSLQYRSRIESVTENLIKYNIFQEAEIKVDAKIKRKLADVEANIEALDEKAAELAEEIRKIEDNSLNYVTTTAPSISGGFTKSGPMGGISTSYKTRSVRRLSADAKKARDDLQSQVDTVITTQQSDISKFNDLQGDILYLQAKNKVETYGELMNNMFFKGKVYRIEMDMQNLLVFGPAFQSALDDVYDRLVAAPTGALTAQQLAIEAQTRREASRNDLIRQVQSGGSVTPDTSAIGLQDAFDQLAQKIADSTGGSPTDRKVLEKAIDAFNPEDYIGLGRNSTLEGISDAELDNRGKKIIYWFYLGDLIEQAIKMNKLHYRLRDDHIIPCIGNFSLPQAGSGKPKTLSIADIPITIDTFVSFFKANILEPNKTEYPLYSFIRDIIQRLAMPAINVMSFGNPQKHSRNLKVTTFELPGLNVGGDFLEPLSEGRYGLAYEEARIEAGTVSLGTSITTPASSNRVNLPNLIKTKKLGNNALLMRKPPSQRYSYFLFYANSSNSIVQWNGDVGADSARGIQHFYIGSDRGLIKEINFRKSNKPGLAEMMAERALRSGNKKVELWRNFEADISMVGNALLKPGYFLYVNPTVAGLGNPSNGNSLSRVMGLGGYYFVLGVSNTISEAGWNTQVRAVWQSAPSSK